VQSKVENLTLNAVIKGIVSRVWEGLLIVWFKRAEVKIIPDYAYF
jgi:hypothetical protein